MGFGTKCQFFLEVVLDSPIFWWSSPKFFWEDPALGWVGGEGAHPGISKRSLNLLLCCCLLCTNLQYSAGLFLWNVTPPMREVPMVSRGMGIFNLSEERVKNAHPPLLTIGEGRVLGWVVFQQPPPPRRWGLKMAAFKGNHPPWHKAPPGVGKKRSLVRIMMIFFHPSSLCIIFLQGQCPLNDICVYFLPFCMQHQ